MATANAAPIFRVYPPLTERPAHVPPELVFDVDIFNLPGAKDGPHAAWKKVQDEKPPVFWTPRHGGYWMAVGPKEILEIQNDSVTYSMREMLIPNNPRPYPAPPIDVDPPEHAKWRLLISPAFSPKAVAASEETVRKFAIDCIEAFKHRGECEFVSEFTAILPIVVFLTMMGLPIEDRFQLMPFAADIVRSPEPDKIHEARMGLKRYAEQVVAERYANPRDDLVTKFINAKIDGEPVPHEKIVGMLAIALSGGLDTLKNLMAHCALSLSKRPDLQKRLREDPAIIPVAIEELCRRHGSSQTARLVTKDTVLSGIALKEGDQIQQFSHLVGLSDETVPNPLVLDFDRPMPIPHATFGNGPHRCPGAILGKKELGVWLEEWFARIPEYTVKPGTVPQQDAGAVILMSELWLSWDAAKVK